jgi:hypothetical protein
MAKFLVLLCFLSPFFIPSWLYPFDEYLYPLAVIEHGDGSAMVYVMHQISQTQTSLLLWNPQTKETFRGLSSVFSPAGFTLLPQKNGFSFIDEGRIRIKYFEKRSPRAIDLYEPLSSVTLVHWIDEENLYLSAKKDGRYGLFQVSIQGDVVAIFADQDYDYLYPCKVDDRLFFVRRSVGGHECEIMSCHYPVLHLNISSFNDTVSAEERMHDLIEDEHHISACEPRENIHADSVVECGQQSVLFLNMLSTAEGFYLEPVKAREEIIFYVCRILCEQNVWKREVLFDFVLPCSLIMHQFSSESLYESLLPFIPRIVRNKIYFSHYEAANDTINLWCFDLKMRQKRQISRALPSEKCLSPVIFGNNICYGGNICADRMMCGWWRENGGMRMELPVVPL